MWEGPGMTERSKMETRSAWPELRRASRRGWTATGDWPGSGGALVSAGSRGRSRRDHCVPADRGLWPAATFPLVPLTKQRASQPPGTCLPAPGSLLTPNPPGKIPRGRLERDPSPPFPPAPPGIKAGALAGDMCPGPKPLPAICITNETQAVGFQPAGLVLPSVT